MCISPQRLPHDYERKTDLVMNNFATLQFTFRNYVRSGAQIYSTMIIFYCPGKHDANVPTWNVSVPMTLISLKRPVAASTQPMYQKRLL